MNVKIQQIDVTIIGNGLSGMISALSFAQQEKKVVIIGKPIDKLSVEVTQIKVSNDNRTTALTYYSLQYLLSICDEVGRQDLQKLISKIKNIYILDNRDCSQMVNFEQPNPERGLGYIISNSELKSLLSYQINHHPNIKYIENGEINDLEFSDTSLGNSTVYLNNINLQTKLIILCNGLNSKLYKKYFTPSIFKYYSQSALTFNVSHEKDHEGCAVEHFMPTGPFAILPLKDNKCSSIVWTVNKQMAKILQQMPIDEFQYHIYQCFGDFLGETKLASNICEFPLMAYVTKQYFYKNMVVVGDTAHIIHPLAGQGLNQGIKDVELLVRLTSQTYITEDILYEYQSQRTNDNMAMYFITDNLNRIFSNDNNLLSFIRANGLSLIDKLPFIKENLRDYASGNR